MRGFEKSKILMTKTCSNLFLETSNQIIRQDLDEIQDIKKNISDELTIENEMPNRFHLQSFSTTKSSRSMIKTFLILIILIILISVFPLFNNRQF